MKVLCAGALLALASLPGCSITVYHSPGGTGYSGQAHSVNTASYARSTAVALPAPPAPHAGPTARTGAAPGNVNVAPPAGVPGRVQAPRFDPRPRHRIQPTPVVAPASRGIVLPRPPASRDGGSAEPEPTVVRRNHEARQAPSAKAPERVRQPAPADRRASAFGSQAPLHRSPAQSRLRPRSPESKVQGKSDKVSERAGPAPARKRKSAKRAGRGKLK